MKRAIYPGSFDPVTNGHLDVIERARKLFDEVIVAVAHNDEKQPLFTLEERLDLLQQTVGKIDNVRIAPVRRITGRICAYAKSECGDSRPARGFRFRIRISDGADESKTGSSVETIFLMPKEEYTYLSSRIVKEIARLGGDVSKFVTGVGGNRAGQEIEAMNSEGIRK